MAKKTNRRSSGVWVRVNPDAQSSEDSNGSGSSAAPSKSALGADAAKKAARGQGAHRKGQPEQDSSLPDAAVDALAFLKSGSLRSTNYQDFSHFLAHRCLRQIYQEGKAGDKYEGTASFLYSTALWSATEALGLNKKKGMLYWGNRDTLSDAYTKLMILGGAEETEDRDVILLHGMVCFALERYAEAQKSFLKLESAKDASQPPSWMPAYIERVLSLPCFMNTLMSRGYRAWKVFESKGRSLLKAYRRGSKSWDFQNDVSQLSISFLDHSGINILIFLEEPLGLPFLTAPKSHLVLFSSDLKLDLFTMEQIIAQIPSSLTRDWDAYIGRPPVESRGFSQEAVPGLRWDDVRISVSDSPDHSGADVLMYHPYLLDLARCREADAQYAMDHFVSIVLGDLDAAVCIRSLALSPTELTRDGSHRLLDLPKLLKKLRYSLETTPADLAKKIHRTYSRSMDSSGGPLRSDIVTGWTECWPLHDEYYRNVDDTFVHYLNQGVGACFIVWPKSLMAGCSRTEFQKKLTAHLDKGNAYRGYHIIGEAEGPEACYLDLLLWSAIPVIEGLEQFFKTIPHGDQARFQAFRRGAEPAPISKAYFTGAAGAAGKAGAAGASKKSPGSNPSSTSKAGNRGVWKRP